jgi:hypothetical protein
MKKFIHDYGIKHLYSEEVFYKTHKVSRFDFFDKLESSNSKDEVDSLINKLYEDES